MNKKLLKDIIDWDIINWSKALEYWDEKVNLKDKNFSCLELGSQKGGLSLWLASKGNKVICSDLNSPQSKASAVHEKHPFSKSISYQAINATNIIVKEQYDIIIFKSILGGINNPKGESLKKVVVDQIFNSLKPKGKLLFAENLESSFLHKVARKKFVKWGAQWNYVRYDELQVLFENFSKVEFTTVGFFGTFGRNEKQRNFLGRIDNFIEKFIPKKYRYIVVGVAEK